MASGMLRTGRYTAKLSAVQSHAANALSLSEPLMMPNKSSRRTDSLSSSDSDSDDYDSYSGDDNDDDDDDETTLMSDEGGYSSKLSWKALLGGALATGAVAVSTATMVMFPTAIIFVMGGICTVNAPVVASKHLTLGKCAGLRSSVTNIQKEVDLLKDEVDYLELSVDNLQEEVDVLADLEKGLEDIADEQGTNINTIIELVNENESILKELKGFLRRTFVEAMIKVVIRSDKDWDMKIDRNEIPLLSLRLQIQLEPFGVKLDTDKFENMIREDNDIANVIKFCGDMLFEEEPDENKDDGSFGSEVTFDLEAFCMNLDDEPHSMSYEEKAGMVTVSDEFSKGSVEVARGKRMTLMRANGKVDIHRKTIVREVKKRQTILAARCRESRSGKTTSSSSQKSRRGSRISLTTGFLDHGDAVPSDHNHGYNGSTRAEF